MALKSSSPLNLAALRQDYSMLPRIAAVKAQSSQQFLNAVTSGLEKRKERIEKKELNEAAKKMIEPLLAKPEFQARFGANANVDEVLKLIGDPREAVKLANSIYQAEQAEKKIKNKIAGDLTSLKALGILPEGSDSKVMEELVRGAPGLATETLFKRLSTASTAPSLPPGTAGQFVYAYSLIDSDDTIKQARGKQILEALTTTGETPKVAAERERLKEMAKKLSEVDAKQFETLTREAQTSQKYINELDVMQSLLDSGIDTGPLAGRLIGVKGLINDIFGGAAPGIFDEEEIARQEAMVAISNQLALIARNPDSGGGLPGATSNKDLQFLKGIVPSVVKTEEGNRLLIFIMRKRHENAVEKARQMDDYIRKNRSLEGFNDQWQKWLDTEGSFSDQQRERILEGFKNDIKGDGTAIDPNQETADITEAQQKLLDEYAPEAN